MPRRGPTRLALARALSVAGVKPGSRGSTQGGSSRIVSKLGPIVESHAIDVIATPYLI